MELARTRPRPPVRALHLGLGNFFRAHQAVFTAHSDPEWGIAAFTGSSPRAALAMERQDCVYTVDVRSAEGDTYEQCEAIAAAHPADNHAAWTGYWADPAVQYLTITVTEAGYRPRSGVDTRILAGLQARRDADAGPISLIPCDNLPSNAARAASRSSPTSPNGSTRDCCHGWTPTSVSSRPPWTASHQRPARRTGSGWPQPSAFGTRCPW
ncbi:MAG: hypothetical protein V9G10_13200 [Candidatus Nanopelagicales bacterium]